MVQRQILQRSLASPIRHAFTPSIRSTVPRRFASDEMPKLTGAADNAFNRERMAVKQHAKASSGTNTRSYHSLVSMLTLSQISGENYLSSKYPSIGPLPNIAEQLQRCGPCPHTLCYQRKEFVGRALGALETSTSVGRARRVSVHEHPDKEVLLGRWGQGKPTQSTTFGRRLLLTGWWYRPSCKYL